MAYFAQRGYWAFSEVETMTERTCAACDGNLDENSIAVKIGRRTVEVCCEECAQKLNEAQLAPSLDRKSGTSLSKA
jgi:hypothetical protein